MSEVVPALGFPEAIEQFSARRPQGFDRSLLGAS